MDDSASKMNVIKVLGDVAYDSREILHFLADRGIEPVIKVRQNSSFRARRCILRRLAVVRDLMIASPHPILSPTPMAVLI